MSAEEQLLSEIAGLGVDDMLALCYGFQGKPERLRLYTNALRRRGGQRAQFASCLICFDLARQGDESFQREFVVLADTMGELGSNESMVAELVGDDPYLGFVWELCQAQLEDMDPRLDGEALVESGLGDSSASASVASFDLLSDDDFDDFEINVENAEMWRQFDEAVEAFLGGTVGVPIYDQHAGFRLKNSKDVNRVEQFIQVLDSLRDFVAPARGFRCLVLLFYGTHLRSKSLFGAINQRKQSLLQAGLAEFEESAKELWQIAGVMGPLHAGSDAWPRIVDVMADYAAWKGEASEHWGASSERYDAVGRLLERAPSRGNRRSASRD